MPGITRGLDLVEVILILAPARGAVFTTTVVVREVAAEVVLLGTNLSAALRTAVTMVDEDEDEACFGPPPLQLWMLCGYSWPPYGPDSYERCSRRIEGGFKHPSERRGPPVIHDQKRLLLVLALHSAYY